MSVTFGPALRMGGVVRCGTRRVPLLFLHPLPLTRDRGRVSAFRHQRSTMRVDIWTGSRSGSVDRVRPTKRAGRQIVRYQLSHGGRCSPLTDVGPAVRVPARSARHGNSLKSSPRACATCTTRRHPEIDNDGMTFAAQTS